LNVFDFFIVISLQDGSGAWIIGTVEASPEGEAARRAQLLPPELLTVLEVDV